MTASNDVFWKMHEQLIIDCKETLDEAGIEIPFPKTDIYMNYPSKTDGKSSAQPILHKICIRSELIGYWPWHSLYSLLTRLIVKQSDLRLAITILRIISVGCPLHAVVCRLFYKLNGVANLFVTPVANFNAVFILLFPFLIPHA